MPLLRLLCSVPLLVVVLALPARGQQVEQVTVPLTDPGRPVTIRLGAVTGSITVRGADRRDVAIEARTRGSNERARANAETSGLQRLSPVPGFEVTEANNVVTISAGAPNATIDFTLTVPTRSSLDLSTVNDGALSVENVEGDVELQNTNGSVSATGVSGSVIAQTVNGQVRVSLTRRAGQANGVHLAQWQRRRDASGQHSGHAQASERQRRRLYRLRRRHPDRVVLGHADRPA